MLGVFRKEILIRLSLLLHQHREDYHKAQSTALDSCLGKSRAFSSPLKGINWVSTKKASKQRTVSSKIK